MKNLLLLISISLLFSCGNGKNYPKAGEVCDITEECFAATSKEKLKELTEYCVQQDEYAIEQLIALGDVTTIMPIFDFVLLKAEWPYYKLKVTDLNGETSEWWVSSQFIKETT